MALKIVVAQSYNQSEGASAKSDEKEQGQDYGSSGSNLAIKTRPDTRRISARELENQKRHAECVECFECFQNSMSVEGLLNIPQSTFFWRGSTWNQPDLEPNRIIEPKCFGSVPPKQKGNFKNGNFENKYKKNAWDGSK